MYLHDGDVITFDGGVKVFNILDNKEVERKVDTVAWDAEQAKKGEFEHYMLKEISEQAEVIKRAISQDSKEIMDIARQINEANGVFFVACGTAAHACTSASYFFSKLAKRHINVVLGSEFPYHKHFLTPKTLVIAVSQSGETADTLESVRVAKEAGAKVISIVNVMGSTLMRESDQHILLNAGPEIGVASTKVYTAMLVVLYLLAFAIIGKFEEGKNMIGKLYLDVYKLTSATMKRKIKALADAIKSRDHLFLLGRGLQYPTAEEAALKIKEVSYIHAESFAGGELKHGPIALIEEGTPAIFLVSPDNEREIMSNAEEIKARGGFIIGVGSRNNEIFDFWIKTPEAGDLNPIVQIMPMQILAYELAVLRGNDPDKPRNLAKSVTVK
jgi:glucosamine--fructose-6-phosphate aminotransferase (isomerizing)